MDGGILVDIETAQALSKVGEYVRNPNFGIKGHPDEKVERYFQAACMIHWRPNPSVVESRQYAMIVEF